jgi:hypothetical protein
MAFDSSELGCLPGSAHDKELAALRAEITRHKNLNTKTALCVKRAMHFSLDGAYSFEELEGVEKSIMGIKIEKYWLRTFGYPMKMTAEKVKRLNEESPDSPVSNTLLDTEICGIPVDVKHTIGDNWMIPKEAIGHWLLLFKTNIFEHTVSVGLFKAEIERLTLGENQDKKKSLRASAKQFIDWIIVDEPFDNIAHPGEIEYDKTHCGNIQMRLWFDGIEQPDVTEKLLTNGRFTGFLVEPYAAFVSGAGFRHVDAKGFDLKSLNEDFLNREVKSFTLHGAKLGPSTFYGAGRKPDPVLFESEIAPSKDFIVVDQTALSKTGDVKLVLKRGTDIAKIGHSVSPSKRGLLFSE